MSAFYGNGEADLASLIMGSTRKRIALFLPTLAGGGVERGMVSLAQGFAERGYSVDLVLSKAEGPYLSKVPRKVRLVDLRASRVLTSLPGLVRYLKQTRPTVMLSAAEHTNVVALWARRLSKVPTRVIVNVCTTVSQNFQRTSLIRERCLPFFAYCFYPWADEIVAVSYGVADDLSRFIGLSRQRIRVIYDPVVTPSLFSLAHAPLDHSWFSPENSPVILGVGRLTVEKDFPTLVRAFACIRARRPVRLVILGEGRERSRIELLIRELGVDSDVSLPGFVANPYAYMARAAVFVLSSIWEGLPGVVIEAMACGTPVVCTNCPSGPAEILENGKYGRLVPTENVDALAEAISSTLDTRSNPEFLRQRASVFTVENSLDQYLKLFRV